MPSAGFESTIPAIKRPQTYAVDGTVTGIDQNVNRAIKLRMRWAGHVTCRGKRRGAYRVLVGKREGRRPLGRPRRRWEDNIKMYVQEIGWGRELN
jgi:hypothetical protein